jgi:cob(I)alamin adenosyltransferase
MPIYTRFGDKGDTSLFGGAVVPKDDPQVDAYGSVDELNAMLGAVISFSKDKSLISSLTKIQKDLFVIGAELSSGEGKRVIQAIDPARVSELEAEIDAMEADMPPLHNFLIPGGCQASALLQYTRTICRRAERSIAALAHKKKINPDIIKFMNRLSDLLFIQARYINYKGKVPETIWKGRKPSSEHPNPSL